VDDVLEVEQSAAVVVIVVIALPVLAVGWLVNWGMGGALPWLKQNEFALIAPLLVISGQGDPTELVVTLGWQPGGGVPAKQAWAPVATAIMQR